MEHLKLFAARLNIPRLIRACEEQQHWRELVFLYVAYDEYDNAALVMMAHRCLVLQSSHTVPKTLMQQRCELKV